MASISWRCRARRLTDGSRSSRTIGAIAGISWSRREKEARAPGVRDVTVGFKEPIIAASTSSAIASLRRRLIYLAIQRRWRRDTKIDDGPRSAIAARTAA